MCLSDRMNKMKMQKSRRSQGHVEMIISFGIFLGFLLALLFFLSPLKSKHIDYTMLDMTEKALLEDWTLDYETVSLSITDSSSLGSASCIVVENKPQLFGKVLAKNKNSGAVAASLSGENSIALDYNSANDFYTLYFSADGFAGSSKTCGNYIPDTTYSFGAVTFRKDILYEDIEKFALEYDTDYEGLKERLGLKNDFAFYLYDEEGIELLGKSIFVPKYVEVIAREIPAIALDKNADMMNIIVNIRAW